VLQGLVGLLSFERGSSEEQPARSHTVRHTVNAPIGVAFICGQTMAEPGDSSALAPMIHSAASGMSCRFTMTRCRVAVQPRVASAARMMRTR
jgi:hypothetical protein